jgi:HD-GYP domain-containing protein (c-di-GMP phosphodiesterase class II)
MLVVSMHNHENDIIGVLQLLNVLSETGEVIPFPVNKNTNIKKIAAGVDEKSKYTGDHIRQFTELTMEIAGKINASSEGPYANVYFDENKLKELKIAAWLHDIGNVTTPEYVVDKATKLETIFD